MNISSDVYSSNSDAVNNEVLKEEKENNGSDSQGENSKKNKHPHENENKERKIWKDDKGNGQSLEKDGRGI